MDHDDRNDIQKRIDQCRTDVAEVGVALKGSVTRRYMPCGKAGCKCMADPPVLHGPYFQWTLKVDGKTRTVRLTEDQAAIFQTWIDNDRRLRQILARWEDIGQDAAREIQGKSSR